MVFVLNHIRVSTELKHHLIIAAPSRLRDPKAPKRRPAAVFSPQRPLPSVSISYGCHCPPFAVVRGFIPPPSAFRGHGRLYTATVRFLSCSTAAISLKKGFQAVLPHAHSQRSQGVMTETLYASRHAKSTTKTPRCRPPGAPSPPRLPAHRTLLWGVAHTVRAFPRQAVPCRPLPRCTLRRSPQGSATCLLP